MLHRSSLDSFMNFLEGKAKPHRTGMSKRKLNCEALHSSEIRSQFQDKVREAFLNNPIRPLYDHDGGWLPIASIIRNTAEEVIRFKTKRHRDRFDENREEICDLITRKNRAHDALQRNPSSTHLRQCFADLRVRGQRELRQMEKFHHYWSRNPGLCR